MNFSNNEIIGDNRSFSWAQLLNKVHALENTHKAAKPRNQWIFRALGKWEAKKPPPITSSFDDAWELPRKKPKRSDRVRYESWMLLDFKREAHHHVVDLPEPGDFLEWLSLARHFEMPSRLVDFTYSFYVAAYFALSRRKAQEDACILAINLTWMKKQVEKKLESDWCPRYGIDFSEASFHNRKLFHQFAFQHKEDYVVPVNPQIVSEGTEAPKG